MKPTTLPVVFTLLLSFFFGAKTHGQTFGTNSSAVWISDCNQSNFYNTSGSGANLIGPVANVFNGTNLGAHTQNSSTLILRGAEVRTFKVPGVANVCSARMHYRIYLQTDAPGSFNTIDLPFVNDCDIPSSQFPSGGSCVAGDQKWNRIIADGTTTPYAPVNLTSFATGNYVLEVYYDVSGSSTTTTQCDETVLLNNGGANYKAFFSIQAPVLASNNPTTCNGTQGSITISGLVPGTTYAVSYADDGVDIGPANFVANGSGQVIISGLNAGVYSNFSLTANGCTTELNTGLILSNPVFTPTFNPIAPFCAGSTAPTLATTSNNGISGTWNPSVIDNQSSGSYTFTPAAGQCGIPVTKNVTVNPNITPTFTFGTSLTICSGGTVPSLPNTSTNGITGTWSPSTVSNVNSATYTFTPTAGQCAIPTTFNVTVTPNVTPTFSFGTSLTICAGGSVPALPTTSDNGITGTWSPSTVDNQNSATYTFTPAAGICATTTTFNVTVTPNTTPTFSFGTTLTICAGGTVPSLPATSDNGITGTWSPATVDNQNSATYTFTPTGGVCAIPVTFSVTVNQIITPTFSFGTSLTICAGATVPSLPNTSTNSINGSWSPSVVDNQNSGTYTFTPTPGQCASTTTFTVTVNPNITPTFSFGTSLTICAGGSVPALPATSDNGITGTWSPSTVDNQNSATYTFTPTAGLCATTTTFNVTVTPNVTPTFSFGTSLTICAGGSVPALPTTSDNGITGTWSPSTVDNQNSATYTFTPTPGQCATPATFTVTANPNITPTFSFGTALTICANVSAPSLPATSSNNITGTWSPSTIDNQNSATYTFTPAAGQCATQATLSVTVTPNVTPVFSFGTSLTICAGGTVPSLPGTSSNGINGTWSPSVVDNQASGTYTFTPTPGVCATPATFTATVTPNTIPTFSFGTSLSICTGGAVPSLPGTSTNGINGTWNPSTVDDQNSATYTFTPDPGICATTTTFNVTVNPIVTPTFSFGTSLSICAGGAVPTLPVTSTNGINGTWSPSTIDNQNSGTYTFTPTAGQCATTATLTVTVSNNVIPTFGFGTSLTICAGGSVPALPTTSDNAIAGTWSPSVVDNQNSATYTFTPNGGGCATNTTFVVTVNPNVIPTFSFGTSQSICEGATIPALPTTSDNGITGTWSPSTVDNQASGTYTFTPTAGLCATTTTFTVTVNPNVTPTFSFGTSFTICSGTSVPSLPVASTNGITGTWNPSIISNQNSDVYTFTPTTGQCATNATLTVTVTPTITPAFDFGTSLIICTGGSVPDLPPTSTNGVDGVWSPAVVSNQTSAVYTFTPTSTPEQCINTVTFTVTVNPILTPTFSFGTSLTICAGASAPVLPTTSTNGITGTWSPSTVDNQNSATYTFTTTPGQCATDAVTFTVTVNPLPTVNALSSITVNDGVVIPVNNFNGTPGNVSYSWTNSNTAIGLAASGTGNVPSFTANNKTDKPISGTITVTPTANGCTGIARTYVVTVNPLYKDVFVPNVFSPNGDGKNDLLLVYGNYIDKVQMRIFNQWGQQVAAINSREKGWDGTQNGKPQPVGVYVYELQAWLSDGRIVKMKGSITLVR
jgi:gliding motility-associated-like protein